MDKEPVQSGAQDAIDGVESDKNQSQDTDQDRTTPKTVSWDNHKRALNDMHKYKKHSHELELKLSEIEDARLREQEQWKEYAKKKEVEATEWKKRAEEGDLLFTNTQKYNAVKKHAVEMGILGEALEDLDLLDLGEVQIEKTDSGRFAVSGAKEFVERLKQQRPFWFRKDEAPKFNSAGGSIRPSDGSEKITPQMVNAAERDYKMGKIPVEKYHDIFNRYVQQKTGNQKQGVN